MSPHLVELSPNRLLLDSNFDGYKLSLKEIPSKKKELTKAVDRILLSSSQYTLLHAKLYGLHNHLIGDYLDESDSVYFIDSDWNICKTYLDPFSDELVDPIVVWQVPKVSERKSGNYNLSLVFVNNSIAVVGDGTGILYIVNTGSRNDDDTFTLLFSDEVAGSEEGFLVVDAVCKKVEPSTEELHVLLENIKQDNEEHFSTILHWITLSKIGDGPWQQIALKQLKTKGYIQYAALERDCNAVYVVSDTGCKFIINSDCPLTENNDTVRAEKTYQWTQNNEDVRITITLPGNVHKELIGVNSTTEDVDIKYDGNNVLCGKLHHLIKADVTTWSLEGNNIIVVLSKSEIGLMWPELVKGDEAGEYVVDAQLVEEVHERLEHLCSESDAMPPQSGSTFNSQQIEECDFETDKAVMFERLNGNSNEVTHKVYLGSHQVLLTAKLNPDLPPAIGIRHDVDLCVWQPQGSEENFSVTHEGTLLAFGYVQASKQNRKYSVCPPDMSYSVICETSGHLFIYRQKNPVTAGELRNRTTGRLIHTIAEQQVVNISNEDIIGVVATNKTLFLLCETSITALKL